jgi:hypothetical protein
MSTVEISDHCLWFKHIHGEPEFMDRLSSLKEGDTVILKIGEKSGAWTRMAQGKNASATPGLRPACDTTKDWGNEQFSTRKGETVSIREVKP